MILSSIAVSLLFSNPVAAAICKDTGKEVVISGRTYITETIENPIAKLVSERFSTLGDSGLKELKRRQRILQSRKAGQNLLRGTLQSAFELPLALATGKFLSPLGIFGNNPEVNVAKGVFQLHLSQESRTAGDALFAALTAEDFGELVAKASPELAKEIATVFGGGGKPDRLSFSSGLGDFVARLFIAPTVSGVSRRMARGIEKQLSPFRSDQIQLSERRKNQLNQSELVLMNELFRESLGSMKTSWMMALGEVASRELNENDEFFEKFKQYCSFVASRSLSGMRRLPTKLIKMGMGFERQSINEVWLKPKDLESGCPKAGPQTSRRAQSDAPASTSSSGN